MSENAAICESKSHKSPVPSLSFFPQILYARYIYMCVSEKKASQ